MTEQRLCVCLKGESSLDPKICSEVAGCQNWSS